MKHISLKHFAALSTAFFLVAQVTSALAQDASMRQQWVRGSWVNVRPSLAAACRIKFKNEKSVLSLLHKKINLLYGAEDFLLDENGVYWFLEMNPFGYCS